MPGNLTNSGAFKNISATANVSAVPVCLVGVLCSASTSGTLNLYDSATTTTSVPITGTINLTAGQYLPIPAAVSSGIYAVVGGTANITLFYA